ncbi:MAG: hypothetical protein LBL13_00470 [Bacteroidales bacterium]|jgi:hypothetical protein|nr:hypothetical protein [Bacteroidales bacterium]
MKVMIKYKNILFLFLAATLAFFTIACISCKKPEPEPETNYRDKYVGAWNFTTIDYIYYVRDIYDTNSLVIIHDTTNFIGTIEKYETDRLKIVFKPNATEPDMSDRNIVYFPAGVNGLIYPVVDETDTLRYPNFNGGNGNNFTGSFSGNEIKIRYGGRGPLGMAASENHTIQGIKINKR